MPERLRVAAVSLIDFAELTGVESWSGLRLEPRRDSYLFLALIRGGASLLPPEGGTGIKLEAGQALMVPAAEARLLPALEGRGPLAALCWLEPGENGTVPLGLADGLATAGPRQLGRFGAGVLHELGLAARREGAPSESAVCLVAALVHGLAESPVGTVRPEPASRRRLAERGAAWLAERADRPVSLDELANALGASATGITRAFKEAYAETPARYHLGLRHREARRLLAETTAPIKEISWKLGFADQYDFSRSFRRCVGMSPREFRRSAALNAAPGPLRI